MNRSRSVLRLAAASAAASATMVAAPALASAALIDVQPTALFC